ncbi:MAG: hypothetical protein EYC62_02630 [Alphaproteobacteria bacterium]|nr:MAG: hypothetical protein EYC62_02630 [Alphaproteobacteria bacterium]
MVTTTMNPGTMLGGEKNAAPAAIVSQNTEAPAFNNIHRQENPAVVRPSNDGVLLKNLFQIIPGARLPMFDTVCAQAFEAIELGSSRRCMAMLCKPGMPVRIRVIKEVVAMGAEGICQILDYGPVDWPASHDKRMAIVIQRPMGDKLLPKDGGPFPKMSEQDIMRLVAQPVITAMRGYASRNVSFRGLRLENLYWEDISKQKIVFGEPYSTPAAFLQPPAYEPLDVAMCDPAARGEGSVMDDIFALGTLMLFLAIGRNPVQSMSLEDLINRRMDEGSFNIYAGQFPIPASILEAARGMIVDLEEDRWNLEDVEAWFRGSRQAIRTQRSPRRASRPMTIDGKNHLLASTLTYAMSRDWVMGAEIIRNKSLDNWLRRSLTDEKLADEVQKSINPSGSINKNIPDDVLMARACAALDKDGPLHFRNFTCKADGIGAALAMAQGDNERTTLITQMITSKLPLIWLGLQAKKNQTMHDLQGTFETIPSLIENKQIGFGLERCIYELNPEMPCLSPALKDHYVTSPDQLLQVFNKMGNRSDRPALPFDRHVAAFIGARMNEVKDGDLRNMGPPADQVHQIIAMMQLLVKMQRVYKMRELQGLTQWCLDILRPVLNRFRNIARRKRITDSVTAAAKSGSVADILKFVDNEEDRTLDEEMFKRAAMEHAVISLRLANLEEMRIKQADIAKIKGERTAVGFAVTITLFFMAVLLYLYFLKI